MPSEHAAKGTQSPLAGHGRRIWGGAALVVLVAVGLLVAAIQIWGGDGGVETIASGPSTDPSVQAESVADAVIPLASFEQDTEGWGPDPETPDIGSASRASDYATHGTHSLQVDLTSQGWVGTEFDHPNDISGNRAMSVDVETVSGSSRAGFAIQLIVGRDWFWCQSPSDLDATGTVTLDLATMDCFDALGRPATRPSDLSKLIGVWLYLREGSFRVDNLRAV